MERDLPMVDAYPMLCCVVSSPSWRRRGVETLCPEEIRPLRTAPVPKLYLSPGANWEFASFRLVV